MSSANGPGRRGARARAKPALRGTVLAALLFGLSASAAVAFAIGYLRRVGVRLDGLFVAVALGAFAAALVIWEQTISPGDDATVEEREPLASPPATLDGAVDTFDEGAATLARRPWLVRLLFGALAATGLAALVPLLSLSPPLRGQLSATPWRRGLRLVRADGRPVLADELEVGSVLTVFPEGFTGVAHYADMANAAVMLVRVEPALLRLPAERAGWAPGGLLAYSKVCTHAGCPVALYRAASHQLFCPCHQSTFDVLDGARVVFGPAAWALPQLPLGIRADGYLIALAGFAEPVGPGFWERA